MALVLSSSKIFATYFGQFSLNTLLQLCILTTVRQQYIVIYTCTVYFRLFTSSLLPSTRVIFP
jgi:hypothetical protein